MRQLISVKYKTIRFRTTFEIYLQLGFLINPLMSVTLTEVDLVPKPASSGGFRATDGSYST